MPAAAVPDVVRDCARAGVRGVVVLSAGFAEASEAGRAAQRELVDLARSSGMRLVGPNCMGVLNTDPAVSLNATVAPACPTAGSIGMLSQSGALGMAILDHLRSLNLGLSTFVSVGNKADVSGNDLLSYWADDPRTRVVLLYFESFGNPRKFARLAPEVARRKPIVAVKSGRSAAGQRAARGHSGANAQDDPAIDALFEHCGVIRTDTLEGMFDVAALLSTQPAPAGNRIGVITNAGGPGILLADACEARGLTLPRLAATTRERLHDHMPSATHANPLDLGTRATPADYEQAIATLAVDPEIDAVVVIYVPPRLTRPEDVAAAIARGAGAMPAEKPILAVFLSARGAPALLGSGPRGPIPSYSFPENAADALAAAVRWERWRARPAGTTLALDDFTRAAVRAVVDRVREASDERLQLPPQDLATILRVAGITFAEIVRTTPDAATTAAPRLGYPLVAKPLTAPGGSRDDRGRVEVGLDGPDALDAAVRRLETRAAALGQPLDGVVLQREVRGGIDARLGVTTDHTFGPLISCALGGVMAELVGAVAWCVPPVTDLDAAELLARHPAVRLLAGFRGGPPGDMVALTEVVQRVAALVEIAPEILDLELVLKVLEPGRGAVVIDGRMQIGPPPGPFTPRQQPPEPALVD